MRFVSQATRDKWLAKKNGLKETNMNMTLFDTSPHTTGNYYGWRKQKPRIKATGLHGKKMETSMYEKRKVTIKTGPKDDLAKII